MFDRKVTVEIEVVKQPPTVEMTVATGGCLTGVAERLAVARKIELSGDARGDALFDGSRDVSIYTIIETLSNLELEALLK